LYWNVEQAATMSEFSSKRVIEFAQTALVKIGMMWVVANAAALFTLWTIFDQKKKKNFSTMMTILSVASDEVSQS
jgi:hypothetical protein